MSDDNRQAYVFLQEGDVIQEGDEWFDGSVWLTTDLKGDRLGYDTASNVTYRRPIQRTSQKTVTIPDRSCGDGCNGCPKCWSGDNTTKEQSDSPTIEQRVTALEARLNAQPTTQPSETCKWRLVFGLTKYIYSPHDGRTLPIVITTCPTCGLRIEVVE